MSKRLTVLLIGAAGLLAAKLAMANVMVNEPAYVTSDAVVTMDTVILPKNLVVTYPNKPATVRKHQRLPRSVSKATPLRMWVVAATTTVTKGTVRSEHVDTAFHMHFDKRNL